jgi:hypothetical protein
VNSDLTSHWAQKQGAGSAGDVQSLPLGPAFGNGRYAMHFTGKSRAWFDVALDQHPQMVFSASQDARYIEPAGGALFISADGRKLFEYYLRPEELTHHWQEFKIDLAEFAGKAVHIEIGLMPLKAGEIPSLAIADPVIYAQETTAPVPEEGERWLFNTATKRHPVPVRFLPNPVRPGTRYQIEIPALAGRSGPVDLLYSFNGGEPTEALRFQNLDRHGRATVMVPGQFGPLPAVIEVRGVRRSGDSFWLAASGKIEVAK